MTDNTTGIVFFAYNTDQINYIKLALIACAYAKRHMPDRKCCLITDSGTWRWYKTNDNDDLNIFDDIVLADTVDMNNKRVHYDSPWHKFTSDFKNGNKHKVLEYTPYDKTLLVDIDYIIQNDSLDYVFEGDSAITLFSEAQDLLNNDVPTTQKYLHDYGIPMLWSTVVYFDKNNELTKIFFDLWGHIVDNYDFYKFLYGFSGTMYRTDFCVSIAAHILNGMGPGTAIDYFPYKLINMSQFDDVIKINDIDDWVYMVNDMKENWKDTLTRITGENIHVMNKRSLERSYDKIFELFDKDML